MTTSAKTRIRVCIGASPSAERSSYSSHRGEVKRAPRPTALRGRRGCARHLVQAASSGARPAAYRGMRWTCRCMTSCRRAARSPADVEAVGSNAARIAVATRCEVRHTPPQSRARRPTRPARALRDDQRVPSPAGWMSRNATVRSSSKTRPRSLARADPAEDAAAHAFASTASRSAPRSAPHPSGGCRRTRTTGACRVVRVLPDLPTSTSSPPAASSGLGRRASRGRRGPARRALGQDLPSLGRRQLPLERASTLTSAPPARAHARTCAIWSSATRGCAWPRAPS